MPRSRRPLPCGRRGRPDETEALEQVGGRRIQRRGEYSTCPSKQNGGDLAVSVNGHDGRPSRAAFALKPYQVEPVATPFGYHLILVTNRKVGAGSSTWSRAVAEVYGARLQAIIEDEGRSNTKIDFEVSTP